MNYLLGLDSDHKDSEGSSFSFEDHDKSQNFEQQNENQKKARLTGSVGSRTLIGGKSPSIPPMFSSRLWRSSSLKLRIMSLSILFTWLLLWYAMHSRYILRIVRGIKSLR